jgi:two-component system sensor histidine kinase SenX3
MNSALAFGERCARTGSPRVDGRSRTVTLTYHGLVAVIIAFVAGALLATMGIVGVRWLRRREVTGPPSPRGARPRNTERMPAETVLELLPTAAVLINPTGSVVLANAAAVSMGIVRGSALEVPELRDLVRTARRTGETQLTEVVLDRGTFPRKVMTVGARAELLGNGDVALVVDDLTESKRVESVRRDFVANVGHEIKTPVGALTLLAEAALDARDDPAAVQHFIERMQHEATRLSRLVQELLDLSRLQGGEPLPAATPVSVDAVVDEAIDRSRLVAEAKDIEIVRGGDVGLRITGSESQLVTAVANLLDNAVAYSPAGTRVAVGVHRRDDVVELAVKDEGIGIFEDDQERIFERFYRVDPARSRETGGTGLGLAIVKHIVSNHGGIVTVWSRPGDGSTFTIRLPLPDDEFAPPTAQQEASLA